MRKVYKAKRNLTILTFGYDFLSMYPIERQDTRMVRKFWFLAYTCTSPFLMTRNRPCQQAKPTYASLAILVLHSPHLHSPHRNASNVMRHHPHAILSGILIFSVPRVI